jgi:hypothetical protein
MWLPDNKLAVKLGTREKSTFQNGSGKISTPEICSGKICATETSPL